MTSRVVQVCPRPRPAFSSWTGKGRATVRIRDHPLTNKHNSKEAMMRTHYNGKIRPSGGKLKTERTQRKTAYKQTANGISLDGLSDIIERLRQPNPDKLSPDMRISLTKAGNQ